jgi:hypothetical protein
MKTEHGHSKTPTTTKRNAPMLITLLFGPLLGLLYAVVLPFVCLGALASLSMYRVFKGIAGMVRRVVHARAHA